MSIADPIRRLTQTMRRVEEGDLHVRCQVSSRTELGRLSDSFNHMIAKTADLMDERLRIEEQKRKSEWKALQAQIQPHFLYNTLDSIIWMSHAGRSEEVVEMTSALAALLRSSIGDGSDTNTLKTEIAHVRSYLTIQKMRYHTLHDEIDIDPQTEDCLLPKLVLQPLVENAIYHGIKVKQQGGTVRIESLLEEDRLLITVEDDGVGMDEETRLANFSASASSANTKGGYGAAGDDPREKRGGRREQQDRRLQRQRAASAVFRQRGRHEILFGAGEADDGDAGAAHRAGKGGRGCGSLNQLQSARCVSAC